MLTVAIPTYDRNTLLVQGLERLLPQLTPDCRLLIVDNASETPVDEAVTSATSRFPDVQFRVVRNRANIGANANVLRCFELCETEWIWVLGDDDHVLPGAVEKILNHLGRLPASLCVNFSYDERRAHEFQTVGLDELADRLDASANLPWISTHVYRTAPMVANLRFGHHYAYSMLPHVATLLVAIGERGVCSFSDQRIVDGDIFIASQWSLLSLALGYPALLDLPMSASAREKLARKLLVTHRGHSIDFRVLVYELLVRSLDGDDPRTVRFLFDQICARGYYFDKDPRHRLEVAASKVLLRFPRATAGAYRLAKHRELTAAFPDRFKRM